MPFLLDDEANYPPTQPTLAVFSWESPYLFSFLNCLQKQRETHIQRGVDRQGRSLVSCFKMANSEGPVHSRSFHGKNEPFLVALSPSSAKSLPVLLCWFGLVSSAPSAHSPHHFSLFSLETWPVTRGRGLAVSIVLAEWLLACRGVCSGCSPFLIPVSLTALFLLHLCGTCLGYLGSFLHKINLLVGQESSDCLLLGGNQGVMCSHSSVLSDMALFFLNFESFPATVGETDSFPYFSLWCVVVELDLLILLFSDFPKYVATFLSYPFTRFAVF